jgi:hypothetical protein
MAKRSRGHAAHQAARASSTSRAAAPPAAAPPAPRPIDTAPQSDHPGPAPQPPAARPAVTSHAPFQPPPAPPRPAPKVRIKVEATQVGQYDQIRRRVGDVFVITSEAAFSDKWMRRVDPATPERLTTGQEALRREHDALLSGKRQSGEQTTDDSGLVLGNVLDD